MTDTDFVRWTKKSRIFIDTSSLMNDVAAGSVRDYIVPTCQHYGIPSLIVIKSVIDELNRLSASAASELELRKAKVACKLVGDLKNNKHIWIIGNPDDASFAKPVFVDKFNELRPTRRLVLFTQDKGLARDILAINHNMSIHGLPINVFKFGNDGAPWRWVLVNASPDGVTSYRSNHSSGFIYKSVDHHSATKIGMPSVRSNMTSPIRAKSKSSTPKPFELKQHAAERDDTPVDADVRIPGSGDQVIISGGRSLCLTNILGRGGEGTAYETNDPQLVCKTYHRERLKKSTIDKLKLMTSRTIDHPAICWPTSVAYNSDQTCVGHVMPKVKGKELRSSVFIKPNLRTYFPSWTRLHLVLLTSKILDAVAYLHTLNVLLGDINPANFLVSDENTVFLVDCDSCQIEGYPCPVGTPPFLAPELYGQDLNSTLRTMEHEYFAVATLVFMLLHTGKAPYSYQGGKDPAENAKQMHFPYPRGSVGGQGVPLGPWRYMFSHLPLYMKNAFHQVFTDKKREPVVFWQEIIKRYEKDLRKRYLSDDLYPTTLKKLSEYHYKKHSIPRLKCARCGDDIPPRPKDSSSKSPNLCWNCYEEARGNRKRKVDNNRTLDKEDLPTPNPQKGASEIPTVLTLLAGIASLILGGNRDE